MGRGKGPKFSGTAIGRGADVPKLELGNEAKLEFGNEAKLELGNEANRRPGAEIWSPFLDPGYSPLRSEALISRSFCSNSRTRA